MMLAVETSGLRGSVAVCREREVVAERCLTGEGQRHAQALVSEADQMLRSCAIRPQQISIVAVSIGPGSFTGLRVGLVFAKTLAWLNQAQLVAVDTLRAIAQQADPAITEITVISDAQRGEYFSARYRWEPESRCRIASTDISLKMPEEIPSEYPVTGPGLFKCGLQLQSSHRLTEESLWLPSASSIGCIGFEMSLRGQFSAPEALEPVYVRASYAEEKRDSSKRDEANAP